MTYQRVTFSGTIDFKLETPTPGLEAETTAWVAAVVGDGGTVSDQRKTLVNALIVSLKADGIFSKLDRLWLFAAENSQSALRDIVAAAQATAVNSPTFAADEGYLAAAASTQHVDTNYNPTTDAINYSQDSAHLSAWSNDDEAGSGNSGAMIGYANANIYATYGGDGNVYGRINDSPDSGSQGAPATRIGLWHVNRSGASATQIYQDGALYSSPNATSGSLFDLTFFVCAHHDSTTGNPINPSPHVISSASIGGSLNSTEAADFYTHLQTYMTAVGL